MSVYDKQQCQFRLHPSDYDKARQLASDYGLTFQKVMEILLLNFVKQNKEVVNIVKKYAQDKKENKGKTFDETEKSDIFEKILEGSPAKNLF